MVWIQVTQQDIDLGRPREDNYCPIALAAQRVFGTKDVSFEGHEINRWLPGRGFSVFNVPPIITHIVKRYDRTKIWPIGPIGFEVDEE